ncbi:MAG: hypothetical protein JRH20_29665 [Deltaproteobacteria bacterium]|nr:hypothetical protein [Deltaproteobacteria bacterium]
MYSVALICEGPSDKFIIEAILDDYLDDYRTLAIQPPQSLSRGASGPFGAGWKGIKRWCESEVKSKGGLEQTAILENADLLVIQVDADVGHEEDIRLARPCPPPVDGANEIHTLILQWLGCSGVPDRVVLCVPAMASETWALVSLFPEASVVQPYTGSAPDTICIECRTDIKKLLRTLGKKLKPKLVVGDLGGLKNQAKGYEAQQANITSGWSNVVATCGEAARFDGELGQWLRSSPIIH